MTYGYARVSTKEQNTARQTEAFKQLGIPEDCIYIDHASGKDFDRPQYQIMLKHALRKGDLLVIHSLDRLGRNAADVRKHWEYLTEVKEVDIKVLNMPLLDTARDKDRFGDLISRIVLEVLGFQAEEERNNIRQRQAEGIAIAKANGVKFGKQSMQLPDNFPDIYIQWVAGLISSKEAISLTGLRQTTFYKLVDKYRKSLSPKQVAEIVRKMDEIEPSGMREVWDSF